MKRKFLCLLTALIVLCSGCSQQQAPPPDDGAKQEQETVENPPADDTNIEELLLSIYLSELDTLETPVREHSEAASFMLMEEDMVARILYPVTGLEQLDQAVEDWVLDTVSGYQAEVANSNVGEEAAELTAEYCSYLVNDSLLGVKLSGVFMGAHLAHPVEVSVSFNANVETGALLSLEDVLLPGGGEALREMVMEKAGVAAEDVDDHLLDHWLLTPDGLEITLVRGDYLPMSAGTVTLLFPYEELDGIFVWPDVSVQIPPQENEEPEPEEKTPVPSSEIDPSKPMLALTFDDGPSAHTERLLDLLAEHGAKATFYVVGNMIEGRADTLRRMAEEGHEIGGHSWNHRQLTKLDAEELTDQFMNTRAKIYEVTGVDPTTMRPPYGSCNDFVKETAGKLGIALINWSVDTLDWKHKNADTVYQAVMDGAKDGAIILCHELHKTTEDAMERVIPALIAEGYQLVTVSQLLTSTGGTVDAGTLYYKR